MDVVIRAVPHDVHSAALAWALGKRGHNVDFLVTTDFPRSRCLSIGIDSKKQAFSRIETYGSHSHSAYLKDQYDVGVFRRRGKPQHHRSLSDIDSAYAARELDPFLYGLDRYVNIKGMSVNPPDSYARSRNKLVQIREAANTNLNIPATLFSTDPDEVLRFFRDNNGWAAVKSHFPSTWGNNKENKGWFGYTSKVYISEIEQLIESIQICPTIYQSYVEKHHELRIVVFGHSYIAAKVYSQEWEETSVDYRLMSQYNIPVKFERIFISDSLLADCVSLMERLQIHFGVFDFAVTEDGTPYFLEVNEMGQWLYLEPYGDFPLLQAVTEFIESNDTKFVWSEYKSKKDMRYLDFRGGELWRSFQKAWESEDNPARDYVIIEG